MSANIAKVPVQLGVGEADYPRRVQSLLGKRAPNTLYALGNLDLLNKIGLGFCGSRKASEKGIEVARDCAEQAAKEGICVVSGNAAGVDFAAHFSSLAAGGTTILVIPEGINHFKVRKVLQPVWDWSRALVISQFEPNASWQAYRAMSRNQLILALSGAMLVIEAGEKGGTFNAGEESLKMGVPLFVAEYKDAAQAVGNTILLAKGAQRLAKSKTTARASLSPVFKAIGQDKAFNKTVCQGELAFA